MSNGEILAELILEGDQEFQSSMEQTGESLDEAGSKAEQSGESMEEAEQGLLDIDEAGAAAGAAMVTVGGAMEQTLQSTKEVRTSLDQTAVSMGASEEEMRSLATEISDANFNMQETSQTMTLLADRGVDSQEEMKTLSNDFNTLAQAVGTETPEATQAATQSMRAFGKDVEDIGENMDTFTFVTKNSSLTMEEFGQVSSDLQPQIDELGLSMDEVAAIMVSLEEQGVGAQKAQEMVASAAESAEGDQKAFREELGVSKDNIEEQQQALDEAEGSTEKYADAAEGNVTTMDRLRQGFEEAKLQAAGFLGPIDALAPALMAAGSAQTLFATVNFSAVIPSITGVMAALTPVLPILIALGAAMTAAAVIWKRDIGGVQEKTDAAVSFIMDILGKVPPVVSDIFKTLNNILFEWSPSKIVNEALKAVISLFKNFTPAGILYSKREEIMEVLSGAMSAMKGAVDQGLQTLIDLFMKFHPVGILIRKRDEIADVLNELPDMAMEAGKGLIESFVTGVKDVATAPVDAVDNVVDEVREKLPFSPAKEGPLSDLDKTGPAFMETIASGMSKNQDVVQSEAEQTASMMSPDPEAPDAPAGESGGSGGTAQIDARIMPGAVKVLGGLTESAREEIEQMLDRLQQDQIREIERLYGQTG